MPVVTTTSPNEVIEKRDHMSTESDNDVTIGRQDRCPSGDSSVALSPKSVITAGTRPSLFVDSFSEASDQTQRPPLNCHGAEFAFSPPLHARVLTSSERNLTQLRIWLACRLYRPLGSVGLCRFGPRSVLKFTAVTRLAEAANIEFIARNTTIPVPRIQDVFTIEDKTYIVMDYIRGYELTHVATSLSADQQKHIFEELKEYVAQMRALQPTNPGRVESADGSGVFDIRFGSRPFPQFDSVEGFHAHIGHGSILKSEIHRKAWPQFKAMASRRYCTRFTHADIAPRNVLINNGNISAIIDWETAGWYPEYWEYTRWSHSNYRSSQSWQELRDQILGSYPDELFVEDYLSTVFTRL